MLSYGGVLQKRLGELFFLVRELEARARALVEGGGFPMPESQSPWQQIFRDRVRPFAEGMVLDGATDFRSIVRTRGLPRDNH